MTCHRIVVVLAAVPMIGFGCKTADPHATRDATPEVVPTVTAIPPPPPVPSSVLDAAAEAPDAGADTAGAVPTKSGPRTAASKPPKTRGRGIATLQVTGNLPKTAADEVLRAKAASFATCHDGGEHGQVQIKVTMNDRGVVEIAKVMKSTLSGGETELCLARVAQRFKFPPPPGGGESTVTFQLKF